MKFDGSVFDADYFERGLESGKSCYQNYRWVPELTIPMAMTILEFLNLGREQYILDFGCAKGFLVKALRLLHRQVWGVDISEYAISQVPPDTEEYCGLVQKFKPGFPNRFDMCIAKDVFEHIPEDYIDATLRDMPSHHIFAVIPLGDNGIYRAKANNYDVTHVLCKSEQWWIDTFNENGWDVTWSGFQVKGIKDSYYHTFPTGHGFFVAQRKSRGAYGK